MMKKISRAFLALTLAAACVVGLLGTPGTAFAKDVLQVEEKEGEDYKYGDWWYQIQEDGTIYITDYEGATRCDVVEFPAEIKGRAVTRFYSNFDPDDCLRINTLIIPETVTYFNCGDLTCGGLKEIIVKEGNPVYRSEDGIVYDKQMKTLLCCPSSREGALTVPEGVEKIGEGAFHASRLSEIHLPDSLREIGASAFTHCFSHLTELVIPSHVDKIGEAAFSHCEKIKEIRLPDGIKTISKRTFDYCLKLSEIYIPESVDSIEAYAFNDCKKLETISLPKALMSIGKDAFEGCDRLDNVVIPAGTTTIGEGAFSSCGRLENIRIPDSVKKIGKYAFDRSGKVTIECSDKSYAKSYAVKNGIPYRIVGKVSGSKLGLTINGQNVKDGQVLKAKTRKAYTLQAMQGGVKAQVEWKTSNAKVASVKAGKVTVKKAGSATITATAPDGKKTRIKLTATKAAVRVSKIQVSGNKSMKRGSKQVLGLAIAPATADNAKVSWKSSDAKIAKVDKNGKVTAKKKGTVVITATAKDKSGKKAKIKISVK